MGRFKLRVSNGLGFRGYYMGCFQGSLRGFCVPKRAPLRVSV